MKKNNSIKRILTNYNTYIFLFVSVVFALFVFWNSSPFYPNEFGFDSVSYKSAAKGMLQGVVPFRDLSSQKGVSFFYIEVIGELICKIFNSYYIGTFIIEVINLFAFTCIAYKTLRYVANKKWSYFVLFITYLFLFATCEAGNLTEEFSLPFIAASVLFATKYIYDENYKLTYKMGISQGVLFAITFWIRPNNSGIVCAVVLFFAISLFLEKNFKLLFSNVASFICSAIVSSFVLLFYYIINGALDEVIYYSFKLNYSYVQIDGAPIDFTFRFIAILASMLVLSVFGILFYAKRSKKARDICILSSCCQTAMIIIYVITGAKYYHYLMLIIECIVVFFVAVFDCTKYAKFKKALAFVLVCTIVVNLTPYIPAVKINYEHDVNSIFNRDEETDEMFDEYKAFSNRMKEIIPDSEKTSVSVPFYYVFIFYFSDTYPFYRDSTDEWISYFDKSLQDKYYKSFYKSPPKWAVLACDTDMNNSTKAQKYFLKNYKCVYKDKSFALYKR